MSKRRISVTGLGYVGLPVAVEFAKKGFDVLGFDVNAVRVAQLQEGYDANGQESSQDLKQPNLKLTTDSKLLGQYDFHIITVPTPVNEFKEPDLGAMLAASRTVGAILKKGDIVVYESTVYPGVCEDVCLPVLEQASGLKGGVDFKIGYSPERINPGDREHTFTKIKKVVSGQDAESLSIISQTYGAVVEAGIYEASSVKVAEAAKVIENTQRDINIALINELAFIFDRMGLDTNEVIDAAKTKWNFLPFRPGLVGGHCIGVDPYYLVHKARQLGYEPQVIASGRKTNDSVGKFVAEKCIKRMIHNGHTIRGSVVTLMGVSFKENCPDLRNSRVKDIYDELREYGVEVQLHDPICHKEEVELEYGTPTTPTEKLKKAHAVIFCVAHDEYKEIKPSNVMELLHPQPVIMDVKALFNHDSFMAFDATYWRL